MSMWTAGPGEIGGGEPAGKLTSIIAAMMCGADSIDDVDVLRAGGTPRVFDEVYAPSTLGIFLREFTFGHANSWLRWRQHLVALAQRVPLLPGIEQRVFVDIDSLLRPVYGHRNRAPRWARQDRQPRAAALGLSRRSPHLDGDRGAGDRRARLRSGRAGSGRAAAWQVKQAIGTAALRAAARSCCVATRRSAPRR